MPDELTDRARKAAEEIAFDVLASMFRSHGVTPEIAIVEAVAYKDRPETVAMIGDYTAIIERCTGDKWIPVTERMPKARTLVLVYCEEKSKYTGELIRHRTIAEYIPPRTVLACDYLDPCGDWDQMCDDWERDENDEPYVPESWYEKAWCNSDYSGWHLTAKVTHWMPLPDMPGKEVTPCLEK